RRVADVQGIAPVTDATAQFDDAVDDLFSDPLDHLIPLLVEEREEGQVDRGVAAAKRVPLHEERAGPASRRGDRRAQPGSAAAGYDDVVAVADGRLAGGLADPSFDLLSVHAGPASLRAELSPRVYALF